MTHHPDAVVQQLCDHRSLAGRLWTQIESIARVQVLGRGSRQYLYHALDDLQRVRDDLAEALDRIDPNWDAAETEAESDGHTVEEEFAVGGSLVEKRLVDDRITSLIDDTIRAMASGTEPDAAALHAVSKIDWRAGPVEAAANARLRRWGLLAAAKDKAKYLVSALGGDR